MELRQRPDTSEAQLKRLLFAEELALLERIRARTDALSSRLGDDEALARSVQEVLAEALAEAGEGERERLAHALAPLVVRALGEETAHGREATLAALRPVAGRLVGVALAEALLAPLRGLDRILARILSPRRWRARIEALVTGSTVAEALARRHPALVFERFLLVHRPTGRPLLTSTGEAAEDDELLTGMLSLVTTFGRDVVGASGAAAGVRSVRFGRGELLLRSSERLTLAVLASGPSPSGLDDAVEALFVDLIARREAAVDDGDGTLFPARRRALADAIARRLAAIAAAARPRERRTPVWALALLLTLLVAASAIVGREAAPVLERRDLERRAAAVVAAEPALAGYPLDVRWDAEREGLRVTGLAPSASVIASLEARLAEELPGVSVQYGLAALPTPEARDAELLVAEVEARLRGLLADGNRQIADVAIGLYDAERDIARLDGRVAGAVESAERAEATAGTAADRVERRVAEVERALAAEVAPLRADLDRLGAAAAEQSRALEARAAALAAAIDAEGAARARLAATLADTGAETAAERTALAESLGALETGLAAAERRLVETTASLGAGLEGLTATGAADRAALAALDARVGDGFARVAESLTGVERALAAETSARAELVETLDGRLAATGAALDGRIDTLARTQAETVGGLAGLAEALAAVREDLDSVEAVLAVEVAGLGDELAGLDRRLDTEAAARTDLADALDDRIAAAAETADAERAALAGRLDGTEAAVDAAIERLAGRVSDLAERTASLGERALAVGAAIEALEARLGGAADRAAVADVADRLAGLERDTAARAAGLQADLEKLTARAAQAGDAGAAEVDARLGILEETSIAAFGALDRRLEGLGRETGRAEEKAGRLERAIEDLRTAVDARLVAMEGELGASLDALQATLARHTIFFDEGEAFSDPDAADRALRDIAMQILRADPSIGLRIVGYADHARGTVETNRLASQQRADFVKSTLVTLGVPAERMSAVGRSTERLISPIKGRGSPNRRAEFEAYYADGISQD